jgi:DNA-binding response OmpR family regulator
MRLLLVEDDPGLARVVEQGLREGGYAVDTAADGEQGLELALLEPYDLLILDWMLPQLSGLDVCRQLRAKGCQTPILLLTARDAIEDRVTGLDSGADDYLVKPFALQELLARVRALLRRPEGSSRSPILRVGSIELDPSTREVRRDSVEVVLTNKEYQLLEYLMRHSGQVVSRDQIIAHVWDYEFTAESNVVDVYIRSLRRKLGGDGGIRTIRGAGYQLVAP